MIQAFHRALQISASLGMRIWDPIYQGDQDGDALSCHQMQERASSFDSQVHHCSQV